MLCFAVFLVITTIVATTASPLYNDTRVEGGCTITSYSQVSNVVKSCTNIIVNGLAVPPGKTLQLDLKSGSTLTFQGTTSFGYGVKWAGPLIFITGNRITVNGASGSKLDGQGPHYWDGKGDANPGKPKFFRIKATGGSYINNIHLLNCPHQCVSIQNSNQLTLSGWNVDVSAGDRNKLGHNTDGFDISSSDTVTIKNSVVKNQDDCVAVNSGKNLHFSNLQCSGGHGLSLSIGMSKTDASKNVVSNVTFSDCTVTNSRNGIHVKTHSDAGHGSVNDITYSNIHLSGITNYGINVQQDYKGGKSTGNPTNNIPIKGLKISKVTGTMSGSNSVAVYVMCGSSGCSNFNWSGVSVSGAKKGSTCKNYKPSGISCKQI
ncbi:unnamed protein product [Psylliodes chrysocephalus]|uniref:endo-polygalacturonase n=1 Tax=Psylliodes chrysocephalus TaxID=3402493 RepID=A0A9P0CLN2_9CUCU|nr:unnamed protein product [Psylliodes chrysocephala]